MTCRTLTIMFTDIVGSTELLTGLGERAGERLRAAHLATLREQLDRHRGREVKSLGDGLMVAFESASDALDGAVRMQQAASREHDGLVSIRIGLSSGDVRTDSGDCTGLPVVEAARLCARATAGQVLVSDRARLLTSPDRPLVPVGRLELNGLPAPTSTWELPWSPETPMRVTAVLADDAVLVREGIAKVLEAANIEVVGQTGDAPGVMRLATALRPDLAIVDVRMPPTYTAEGIEAAEWICAELPGTGVLVLTMDVEPRYAARLLAASRTGIGYLLKERVNDLGAFAQSARRVAAGGTAFDPEFDPNRAEVCK